MSDEQIEILKNRLRNASAEFQARDRRHRLKTENVIYCSFSTNKLTVSPEEAQRNATKRLHRFGVSASDFFQKRVLDLGCNNGAMLFEISGFQPKTALGIEYDADKVALANDIVSFCGLANMEFRCQDIDLINAQDFEEKNGSFDVVLCLAIEKHVKSVENLFSLLSVVTRDLLLFEANSGTDSNEVVKKLSQAGFEKVEYIGFCDDDVRPSNNKRPLFVARKVSRSQ